jgi:hypothetical protein
MDTPRKYLSSFLCENQEHGFGDGFWILGEVCLSRSKLHSCNGGLVFIVNPAST